MEAYLDNGNTTPVDERVVEAMEPYFTEKYGHPLFIYSKGKEANEAVETARDRIKGTVEATDESLTFTSGEAESLDLAIRGSVKARKHRGNNIVTSKVENPSVLRVYEKLERDGFDVDYLDVNEDGIIDLDQLKESVGKDTILVTIGHVCDEIGTIQPIKKISKIVSEKNPDSYFHMNASASYGKLPISIQDLGIDLLTLSAHKIHGPKGVGALITRKNVELKPINFGHLSLSSIRPGTENIPGIVGFGKAAELAFQDFESKVNHLKSLRDRLIEGIQSRISNVVLHGPEPEKRSPTNVNFSFKNAEGESIMLHLDMQGICVSTGSACASKRLEPSHVLSAIGVGPEVAHGSIRFTLSRMNTEDEIEYTIDVLPKIIERLRQMSPMTSGGNKND